MQDDMGENRSEPSGVGRTGPALDIGHWIGVSAMPIERHYTPQGAIRNRAEHRVEIDAIRRVLQYDEATGKFTWISGRGRSTPGRPAGSVNGRGYVIVTVCGVCLLAHRVAWALINGGWPEGVIDHINGDTADNRIANLRDVSQSINQRNRRCGKGISRYRDKWRVQVGGDYFGVFCCLGDAVAVRNAARARMDYGPIAAANWQSIGQLARLLAEKAGGDA